MAFEANSSAQNFQSENLPAQKNTLRRSVIMMMMILIMMIIIMNFDHENDDDVDARFSPQRGAYQFWWG